MLSTVSSLPLVSAASSPDSTQAAEEIVCRWFCQRVNDQQPEVILQLFEQVFNQQSLSISAPNVEQAIVDLLKANREQEFHKLLKRVCFILINNWEMARNYTAVGQLLKHLEKMTASATEATTAEQSQLQGWMQHFVQSPEFEELKLYQGKYRSKNQQDWKNNYSYFLLVNQSLSEKNSPEQRQAAKLRSQHIKSQFKKELALYIARCQSGNVHSQAPNPTRLGDNVILLVQKLLNRQSHFSYLSLARLFLSQTRNQTYAKFKQNLQKYLTCYPLCPELAEHIKAQFTEKFQTLFPECDRKTTDAQLLVRTCDRLINYLTIEKSPEPSALFIQLIAQHSPLTLVSCLLKIILISPQSKQHLEQKVAQILNYYSTLEEQDCQWLINFVEILQISLIIYTETSKYEVVDYLPNQPNPLNPNSEDSDKPTHSASNCQMFPTTPNTDHPE